MKVPDYVQFVTSGLEKAGFQAFVVGGCVRDVVRNVTPKDWDVTTDAAPEQVTDLFDDTYADNTFGTVTVRVPSHKQEQEQRAAYDLQPTADSSVVEVEVTPFRTEESYSDNRHPDRVQWADTVEEDLARRDFTVNAIAARVSDTGGLGEFVDPYGGRNDIEQRVIRAVGDPAERFAEDALRLMRAVRFAVQLSPAEEEAGEEWHIEENTLGALNQNVHRIADISAERVRDELIAMIMTPRAKDGVEWLRTTGLLHYILPELEENIGITQNKHHIYTCYEHAIYSLNYAAMQGYSRNVRIAALLHDVGKPRVKAGEGEDATFYNHEVVGADMTREILKRLRFPKKDVEHIVTLVRYHLFYYNVEEVGESSVRRLVRNVGYENMADLIRVRKADRIGSGVPKAEPYKLRHLRYMIERVSRDPLSPKMLAISGSDVIEELNIGGGPKIGQILDILLGYVLDEPENNNREFLLEKVRELGQMPDDDIAEVAQEAREERDKIEQKRDEMTKQKYWVS